MATEITQLENYVKVYRLQIEDRGNVNFSSPKNINQEYRIAPLILMVFVENAFKHSTSSQVDNIVIDIRIQLSDDARLHFVCQNSFTSASNKEITGKGIGLENVSKRLDLLYHDAYDLQIEELNDLYKVDLTIDLKKSG